MLQNFKKILKVATLLDVPKIADLIDTESQTPSRSTHSPSAKLSAILLKKFKQILAGSTRLEVPEIGYLIDQVDRMTGESLALLGLWCIRYQAQLFAIL